MNIFSCFVDCPFILLTVSVAVQKSFGFSRSHLSIFVFIAISFGDLAIKSLPRLMSRRAFPKFSQIFIVLDFTWLRWSKIILRRFLYRVSYTKWGPVSIFCIWLASYPSTIYWIGSPFLIAYFLSKIRWLYMCSFVFRFSILFHWYVSVVAPIPGCFG